MKLSSILSLATLLAVTTASPVPRADGDVEIISQTTVIKTSDRRLGGGLLSKQEFQSTGKDDVHTMCVSHGDYCNVFDSNLRCCDGLFCAQVGVIGGLCANIPV